MGCDGSSSPKLINCTVTDNYAYDVGAGIYTGSYLANANEPTLVNCIVWGNKNQWGGPTDFNVWHENHFYISYSLIGKGFTSHGDGVIQTDSADPLFVNPDNGDYRLQSGSPCINSGTASDSNAQDTDLDGETRDSLPDMGAYEYTGEITTGSLTVTIQPSGVGGKWSPNSGTTWYSSGATAALSAGNYTVSFSTVSGYDAPASRTVSITVGGSESLTGTYTAQSGTSSAYPGYTLFMPIKSTSAYLIDNDGESVHTWESTFTPALSVYLLENGNLLRTAQTQNSRFDVAGRGGKVMEIAADSSTVWEYSYSSDQAVLHHDIEYMSDGNILMIAWEYKSYDEAVAAGRNPNNVSSTGLYPDTIIEVNPDTNAIVWEWHVWDHLVQDYDAAKANYGIIADHPEFIDLNFVKMNPDWTHFNSVDYNEESDQIMVSVHEFSEIWIIDHSTTTTEAAGHTGGNSGKGGDLLYRWGNPQAYDAGSSSDQKLFKQHDATWIDSGCPGEGNILVFNNGMGRPGGNYSSVEEITPPVDSERVHIH